MIKKILLAGLLITLIFVGVKMTDMIGPGINSPISLKSENTFPNLMGIDLMGEEIKLPQAFDAELNLVIVGFIRDHQTPINTWIEYYENSNLKEKGIKLFEIPLISSRSKAYRLWINNGMRSGIPDEAARKRTITVYTDREKFFELMDMKEDRIYALLINKYGKVIWRTEGPFSKEKQKEVEKKF